MQYKIEHWIIYAQKIENSYFHELWAKKKTKSYFYFWEQWRYDEKMKLFGLKMHYAVV